MIKHLNVFLIFLLTFSISFFFFSKKNNQSSIKIAIEKKGPSKQDYLSTHSAVHRNSGTDFISILKKEKKIKNESTNQYKKRLLTTVKDNSKSSLTRAHALNKLYRNNIQLDKKEIIKIDKSVLFIANLSPLEVLELIGNK